MNALNDRQQQAVCHVSGPLLVLAGAGSGKTSVITQKIAYLISQCGYQAKQIAAVTFTNKAAREMKERASKLLRQQQLSSRGLMVCTFHNLGLTLLRKEVQHTHLRSGFTLFDQQDCVQVIKEIMAREHPDDLEHAAHVQHLISNWKNDMRQPHELVGQLDDPMLQVGAAVFVQYEDMLKAYNAVDFDDLINLPVQLLQAQPSVRERWQRKLRYLLVDEYQDTNLSQYQLVKLLVREFPRFTVVGDDDQSIYSWRGARPENLGQLQQDFPQLKIVKLEQNYRSTSRILRVANQVIDNNPHLFTKQLWSQMGDGEPIRVVRTKDEMDEMERVCLDLQQRKLLQGYAYGDFAILYRGNHQARLLELKLQQLGLPYKISGGSSFFAKAEIKDMLSYLRLLVNPSDDAALLRIINTPRRDIGAASLQALHQCAQAEHCSLLAACQHPKRQLYFDQRQQQALGQFAELIEDLSQQLRASHKPIQLLRQLCSNLGYDEFLRQDSSNLKAAEKRLQNTQFLFDGLERLLENNDDEDESELQLQEAVSKLMLRDLLERQEENDDDFDAIQLMTLHASKGLEFPHVYLIGAEEDIIPHRSSIEEGNLEEERRLMYVGITRAKKSLCLTWAAKRKQYGEIFDCSPSRFIEEMPQTDLSYEGLPGQKASKEAVDAVAKAAFASMLGRT